MQPKTPLEGDNFSGLTVDQLANSAMLGTFRTIADCARVTHLEASVALLGSIIATLRDVDHLAVSRILVAHQFAIATEQAPPGLHSQDIRQNIERLKSSIDGPRVVRHDP